MKNLASTLAMLLIVLFIVPIDGLGADKQQFCNSYADSAVKQYNQSKKYNLPGIVPPAWSNDRNGHYNWCMVTPENVANSESAMRQAYLEKYIHDIGPCRRINPGKELKVICIRIKNTSPYDYELLLVGEKFLGDLKSGKVTEYRMFNKAYRYNSVRLAINSQVFRLIPIDYFGETPLEKGYFTYNIGVQDLGKKVLAIETIEDTINGEPVTE